MIRLINAQENITEFTVLVREYTDAILQQDAAVAETLESQHLEDEMQDTEKKYGYPYGRMYILLVDEKTAGCVALSRNDEQYCEMKRLYVRPEYRGNKLSQVLCDKVIEDAKSIGYKYVRLDTFPFMKNAIALYEKYGFTYIERYNDNPAQNAIFMELEL